MFSTNVINSVHVPTGSLIPAIFPLQASLVKEEEKNKEQERHLAEKDETTKELSARIAEFEAKQAELITELEQERQNNEAKDAKNAKEVLEVSVNLQLLRFVRFKVVVWILKSWSSALNLI